MPHHLQNFKSFLTSHPCLHGWETKYFPLNHFWLSCTIIICHIPTSKESSNTLLEESCCRKLTRCYESSWQSCWPHVCKHPCIPLSQFNSLDKDTIKLKQCLAPCHPQTKRTTGLKSTGCNCSHGKPIGRNILSSNLLIGGMFKSLL